MTDGNPVDPGPVGSEESEPTGPKITDKRRLDPETGAVRGPAPAADEPGSERSGPDSSGEGAVVESLEVHPDTTLAADLTRDLQRLQAEYVNYKRRVDRDRELHRDVAVGSVIEALLPVLDDIHLARQHGDLEVGPFAAIAEKLEGTLTKFGVERFGQPGDAFDPMFHEALMHTEAELAEGTKVTTVVQVMQPGYRMGERLIRAARVAVADPQT
ncbi:MAG: nucleotide exchange factor GrpE [Dermatophilaceae bacterium]